MSASIQTVLIASSLRPAGDTCVHGGLALARALDADVHLVHAFELPIVKPGFVSPASLELSPSARFALHQGRLLQALDDQLVRLGVDSPEPKSKTVTSGRPHRVVIDTALQVGADLIVVGTAESPFGRVFGSTANRVVRKAPCPVLALRGHLPLPPERVLMPVDLSLLAADAVRQGLEILGQMGAGVARGPAPRAEIELFHVVVPGNGPVGEEAGLCGEAAAEIGRFLSSYGIGRGWRLAPRAAVGSAIAEIVSRVEQWRPDLVVLGTHGYSGFERFLLGSVAEEVIRRALANTLLIPPRAAREDDREERLDFRPVPLDAARHGRSLLPQFLETPADSLPGRVGKAHSFAVGAATWAGVGGVLHFG